MESSTRTMDFFLKFFGRDRLVVAMVRLFYSKSIRVLTPVILTNEILSS